MSGRGGAGNIEAALQAANKVASQDVEPSQRDAEVGGVGLSIADDAPQGDRQYAHSGRGGAGNFFSPKELSQTGAFTATAKSPTAGDTSELKQALDHVPMVGRGGAGNFRINEQTLGSDSGSNDPNLKAAIEKDLEKALPQEPTPAHIREEARGQDQGFGAGEAEALDAAAR